MSVVERLSVLTPEQRALFEALRRKQRENEAVRPLQPPPVRPVSGAFGIGDWPLSFDQERLWQLHRDNSGLVSWNVDAGSHVVGELNIPLFITACRELIRRHAAWRTTFPVVDGRPVQRVHPFLEPEILVIDLGVLPSELREHTGHAAIYDHTRQTFDLEQGPLLRIALVRLSGREHLYLVTIHHLATDWIAFQVFFGELMEVYEALRAGRPSLLPPLPVQYPDYVLWEREWLQGEVLEAEAAFWRRELEGFPLVLDLLGDRPRPSNQTQRGGLYRVRVGAERTDRLRALARHEGATMFMAVLAVLYALLWRVTGREKLIIGSNSANRVRPEVASVAGFFLTQVPFAADLAGDPTFRELLARTRRTALSAYAHQNFPFSKLIESLGVAPDSSRNPVVQVLLLILEGQSYGRSGDLEFRPVGLYDGNSRWDLMFGLYDYHDVGLSGPLEYNADIFDAPTVGRLLELFYRLIDAVTADPEISLSQLPSLTEVAA
ncbi:MAG TPA: condensation domain-containing protein [Thermoanaerobaculia bacterium]|nr:condensation domain-containing protein [Thermoanaerobaculia bacterium]